MSEQPQLTALDYYRRVAKHKVVFYSDRIESELKWLEGNIATLREDIGCGRLFEYRNLGAKAADVIEYAGKLRAAIEQAEALDAVAEETQ